MKNIECINFVSIHAPKVLLIGGMHNRIQSGYYLKHFKNSHNLYAIYHDTDSDYEFYYDLPNKHSYIEEQLNKNNLNIFIVSSLSFGGLLAYYLIFHFPERVEKAFIHDYHFRTKYPMKQSTNLTNWNIKSSDIYILVYLFRCEFITEPFIKELVSLFPNLRLVPINENHWFTYELKRLEANILFFLYNGFSLKSFWNKHFKNWIENKYKFKKLNSFALKYFVWRYKK